MARLRPVRAGIVNLWDYSDQQFEFHGGRLVLRGPNGSGKTKALELLFPFLLDASLAPQRLDPFSGTGRTMRDNLLYRPDRETVIGYAWLELADGAGTTWVIGAGLRGQRARTDVKSWFFVTDRPYGDGWSVLDESYQPLTENRLTEVLGTGSVFDTAARYRERVSQVLFGPIGADRYAALIQLVLFLRRPQLAKDLDLARLSDTLSAGLRPVDDDKLLDAASSFEDLETVQRDLDRLEQACTAVEGFLRAYRPYVRVVARHRVDAVLAAQRDERSAERAISTSQERAAVTGREHGDAQQQLRATEADGERLRAERETQLRSEAYRSIGQLDDLRRAADAARRVADEASVDEQRLGHRLESERSRTGAARDEVAKAVSAVANAFEALRADAVRVVPDRMADVDGWELAEDPLPPASAVLRERGEDLRAVRELRDAADRVERDAERADRELSVATTALDTALESLAAAEAAVGEARQALVADVEAWATTWPWVDRPTLDSLRLAAREGEPPGLEPIALRGSVPVREAIVNALAAAGAAIARERGRLAELLDELRRVEAEHDDAPPVPPVVRRDRTDAPGAPLWRLVDFAGGMGDAERAGLEAALMGAGLLDAWVRPDGLAGDELDAFLTPVGPGGPQPGGPQPGGPQPGTGGPPTLAELLAPDPDAPDAVPAATVLAVLGSIRVDRIGISVDPSGSFVLGPLAGRTTKDRPEYIGSSARAARRQRRAAELRAQIIGIEATVVNLEGQRAEAEARRRELDASIRAIPSEEGVARALRRADGEARAVRERRADADRRAAEAEAAAARRREAVDALVAGALGRALPHDHEGLAAFATALTSFDSALNELRHRWNRRQATAAALAAAEQTLQQAEGDALRSREVSALRRGEANRREAEYHTLHDSVGADAQLVQQSLQLLDDELRTNGVAIGAARQRVEVALEARTKAAADAARAVEDHERARVRTTSAMERLKVLRRPDLRAALGADDAADLGSFVPVVAAASKDTVATDERRQATKTAVRNAFQTLESQLGARHVATLDDADDIDVVMIADDDGRAGVAAFAERITRRRDEQRLLLSAQERQVLEDALVDSLCRQLFHRLRDAEAQVRDMNGALSGRRTTSGTGVQLSWTDGDAITDDQRRIVRLLARDPGLMGAEDRAQLREALAAEIRRVRALDGRAGYYDVLNRVLDYRSWRVFGIRLSERDGTSQVLTKRVFNTKSGGEKATILHLPLFAAAASHFDAAAPWAPRLVALDEAFAGIDAGTTRALLALTVQFDLDLLLTGHDFWGAVAEVPQLSIVTLSHDRSSHTVAALNGRWDGTTLSFDG